MIHRFAIRVPLAAALLFAWAVCVEAREVSITILHTTDLHGFIWPVTDYNGNENVGGLLRLASAIEAERADAENVLLLDSGDTYQGGPESFLTEGRMVTRALDWLGYDAWVLGNHEFDWGLEWLKGMLGEGTTPALGANIAPRPGTRNPIPDVKPFIMRDVDGVRVAIIGLTTPAIPTWSRPHLLGNLVFSRSVETLRNIMPAVRGERPDVMILIVHQGLLYGDNWANEINAITRHFPELDLILGGHTHQVVPGVEVNGVLYMQPGYHGIWLGRVDLVYDTIGRRLIRREGRVVHVGDQYEKHPGLHAALRDDLEETARRLDERIGRAETTLAARTRVEGQSPVQQLIGRAIADAVDAEIVLHGIFSGDPLPEGDIRLRDLWSIIPYENSIGVVMLTPRELARVLEENAALLGSPHFQGVYGVRYELHAGAAKGKRVRDLRKADGSHLHPRKRYRVAMNSYVLASGGERFAKARLLADRPVARLRMMEIDTRTAVGDYIRRNSPLQSEPWDYVTIVR